MKKLIVILIFASHCLFALDSLQLDQAKAMVDEIVKGNYDSVLTVTNSMSKDSTAVLGPFLQLLCLTMRDLDFEYSLNPPGVEEAYVGALAALQRYKSRHGETPWYFTLRGMIKSSYTSYHLRAQHYWSVFSLGLDALDDLKQAKAVDSTQYDADFFLGLYEYSKREIRKKLWWLLLNLGSENVELGITKLELCSRKAHLSFRGAQLALVELYEKENHPHKADSLLQSLSRQFPQSRFVWWARARLLTSREKTEEAMQSYETLVELYEQSPYGGFGANLARFELIKLLEQQGEKQNALLLSRQILASIADCERDHCRDLLKQVLKFREKNLSS